MVTRTTSFRFPVTATELPVPSCHRVPPSRSQPERSLPCLCLWDRAGALHFGGSFLPEEGGEGRKGHSCGVGLDASTPGTPGHQGHLHLSAFKPLVWGAARAAPSCTPTLLLLSGVPCTENDYKLWSPSDERGNECLLGHKTVFKRRTPHATCFNGEDFDRPVMVSNCSCTREDFEW